MNNYVSENQNVNPSHYKRGGMEAIDVIEAFTSNLCGTEAFDTGNALKYILRWKEKNGKEDIEKAIWYLTHLKNHLEKTQTTITSTVVTRKVELIEK